MKNTLTNTQTTSSTKKAPRAKLIKLGIDVHADSYRVVRQIDNNTPQPAQKFTPTGFLVWVVRQLLLAEKVHSCYEAGPFGYSLHRELLEMGVQNIVVRPQNWDEHGRKVKTDKTDALALVQRLDRYVQGNRHALARLASMSRKGNCYDNATMESFWSTLKLELVYRRDFQTRSQARTQIFDYIETFYNRQRTHSALDYHSPVDFETINN